MWPNDNFLKVSLHAIGYCVQTSELSHKCELRVETHPAFCYTGYWLPWILWCNPVILVAVDATVTIIKFMSIGGCGLRSEVRS